MNNNDKLDDKTSVRTAIGTTVMRIRSNREGEGEETTIKQASKQSKAKQRNAKS